MELCGLKLKVDFDGSVFIFESFFCFSFSFRLSFIIIIINKCECLGQLFRM